MTKSVRIYEEIQLPAGTRRLIDVIAFIADREDLMNCEIDALEWYEDYYSDDDDEQATPHVLISGKRPKTPEEIAAEEGKKRKAAEARRRKQEQKELAQLAKLKAKYETT